MSEANDNLTPNQKVSMKYPYPFGDREMEKAETDEDDCFEIDFDHLYTTGKNAWYTVEEAFFDNIEQNGDQCWLWTGPKSEKGYGLFSVGNINKRVSAHRVMAIYRDGVLPEGSVVCHTCDTPSCVNPNHLIVADHKFNTDNAIAKGRRSSMIGEENYQAVLTELDVRCARLLHFKYGHSMASIARLLQVSEPAINKIMNGTTWKNLPLDDYTPRGQ